MKKKYVLGLIIAGWFVTICLAGYIGLAVGQQSILQTLREQGLQALCPYF